MKCVNDQFFNNDALFDCNRGLRIQGKVVLNYNFILFKFVQRCDILISKQIQSPWWFQTSSIRNVLLDARNQQGGIADISLQARQNAGLSDTWKTTGSQYIISASVFSPLRAYWGPPKAIGSLEGQRDRSGLDSHLNISELEIIPDPECIQFYIPGFYDSMVTQKSIKVITRTKFNDSIDLASGEVEAFIRKIS